MGNKIKFSSISPKEFTDFNKKLELLNVNTICNEGVCPNRPECFRQNKIAFLILGKTCTRSCKFCNIQCNIPSAVDLDEPRRVAEAVKKIGIKYAIITSVTRDDLQDGGSDQFVRTIKEIRNLSPDVEIEVLIPDFKGNLSCLNSVIYAKPKVINHNIECVFSCFKHLRPMGNYEDSLNILKHIKSMDQKILTKSGFMVGVGESFKEIEKTLKSLKKCEVDIITIGQYLPPKKSSFPAVKFYSKEEFEEIKKIAEKIEFKKIFIGANIRSSYIT